MLTYIRPVGEPVKLTSTTTIEEYSGFDSSYLQSGTQALQLALTYAKKKCQSDAPEVILPAYACPDLISACVGANVKPILVDLAPDMPFPNTEDILALSNEHTVGVVLVNFLGISPPKSLFNSLRDAKLLIIEDRAQSFVSLPMEHSLQGDMIIFSFGKGKPVSLLGGGALLVSQKLSLDSDLVISNNLTRLETNSVPWSVRLKATAYNLIIRRFIYYWLLKMPGLKVGATKYKEPKAIERLGTVKVSLLGDNILTQHKQNIEAEKRLEEIVSNINASYLTKVEEGKRLLRYPILMNNKVSRDHLINLLTANGIGASSMYNAPLTKIKSIPLSREQIDMGFPNANSFAERLLTLPCHSDVNKKALSKIQAVFKEFIQSHPELP